MKQGLILLVLSVSLMGQTAADAMRLFIPESGPGIRAQALGQAYLALADDISGLYWNPAGIGQVKTPRFTLDIRHGALHHRANYQDQITASRLNWTRLNSLGILYPLSVSRGALTVALAYERLGAVDDRLQFSGFSTVPNALVFLADNETVSAFDRNVLRQGVVEENGGPAAWTAGISVAVSPTTLVGLSLRWRRGNDQYHYQFRQVDSQGNYSDFPEDYDTYDVDRYIRTTYRAWQLQLGTLTSLGRHLRLGLSLSPPFTYQVREVYTEEEILTYDNGDQETIRAADPGQWDYAVTSAYQVGAGLAFVSARLTLSAAIRYQDFSQVAFALKSMTILDEGYLDLVQENAVIRSDYRERITTHLGGEIMLVPGRLALQGGWQHVSPITATDQARSFFSGGLRYAPDEILTLQLSLTRESSTRQSADEFTPAPTVEALDRAGIILGLDYNF
ncbi:MAG: hypothetical protein ACE5D8_09500 [Fidelibacterota bacterium]